MAYNLAQEQADDAAALIDVLDLAPAAIFGTSSGGAFALEMVIRHPLSVLRAGPHEPALVVLFDDPAPRGGIVTAAVEEGMRLGGRRLALERFIRLVAGDANWNVLDSEPAGADAVKCRHLLRDGRVGYALGQHVLHVVSYERIGLAPDQQCWCGDVLQLGVSS